MSPDLPAVGLLQQLKARAVNADDLEVLGKHASSMYRNGRAPNLTLAVVETVKQAGLSPEQVQRVIEFTNQDAFLTEFRQEKSAHRVVELDGGPADPSEVFKDLNDGGSPSYGVDNLSDYRTRPSEHRKVASARQDLEKTASAELEEPYVDQNPIPYADPLRPAYDAKHAMAGARDHATYELSLAEGAFADVTDQLYNDVKQAALAGSSLGEVITAWSVAPSVSTELVKAAFAMFTPRLVREQVFATGDDLQASFQKTAQNRRVNVDHPVVQGFEAFCQSVVKMAQTRAARDDLQQSLDNIDAFIHAATMKIASGERGIINHIYDLSGAAGNAAGSGAEWAARKLVGGASKSPETVKKVVSGAIKHVPTAAAVVGANEARRHLNHSPTFQAAKNTTLQLVPGTPQYRQREMELAYAAQGMDPMMMGGGF